MPSPAATPFARYIATTGLWQDTAGTIPATADGATVSRWDDQSGNGNHLLLPAGVGAPILKLNIINGQPVVRFNPSTTKQYLQTGTLSVGQPFSYWMAYRLNSPDGGNWVPIDGLAASGSYLINFQAGTEQGVSQTLEAGYWSIYGNAYGNKSVFWEDILISQSPNLIQSYPQIVSCGFNGTNSWIRVNDSPRRIQGNPGATGVNKLTIGCSADGANPFKGDIAEVIVYARDTNGADDDANLAYGLATYNTVASRGLTVPSLLGHGHSLTYGSGGSTSPGPYPGTTAWLNVAAATCGQPVQWLNVGVPGVDITHINHEAPFIADSRFDPNRKANIAILQEAINWYTHQEQQSVPNPSASTFYGLMQQWNTYYHTAGWKTCVLTPTPSNLADADFNTTFLPALRSLILANSAGFDAIADVYPQLSDNTDLTKYSPDGTHWTDLGHQLAAAVVVSAIQPLLTTPVTMDSPCPIDSVLSVRRDFPLPIESLGGVRRDALAMIDSTGSARADWILPLDSLATQRLDTPVLVDSLGTVTVTMDSVCPIESLGSVRRDATALIESLAGIRVDALGWIDSNGGQSSSLTDNLGLMYQQVVDELTSTNLFKTKAVFLSLLTDPFPSADYPQVVVRPGACQPIEGQLLGGGRYTAGVRGSFKVILWTRNATDLAYQDTNLLTAQTRGALWLANNIVDLLLELFPTFPATGLPITEDGLKFGGYDEPERWKDPKDTRDHRSLDAGGIVTTWHFTVRLSLTGAP